MKLKFIGGDDSEPETFACFTVGKQYYASKTIPFNKSCDYVDVVDDCGSLWFINLNDADFEVVK